MFKRSMALFLIFCLIAWLPAVYGKNAYPKFNIGVTGIWATIEASCDKAPVVEVTPGSPADTIVQIGDIITAVNGSKLEGKIGNYALGPDPRRILGDAIGKAEATDGKLTFTVLRNGAEKTVTVTIPVLGPYADTWPSNCKKSETIVQQTIAYLKRVQKPDGSFGFPNPAHDAGDYVGNCFASLLLLSTNDPDCIERAGRCAAYTCNLIKAEGITDSHWSKGYIGILLAEYYLKTGDRTVLPTLAEFCKVTTKYQITGIGTWGHGGPPGPQYSNGGAMNLASLPILCSLALARECGVKESEPAFQRCLAHFSRFPGHDGSAYGDQRGDSGEGGNGKDALSATAFSLIEGKPYKLMSELMALQAADSYPATQTGHGGCAFNVLWRGIGTVHLNEEQEAFYRRQMDNLAWLYDLSRLHGGGFNLHPPKHGTNLSGIYWGIGMALAYTAPQRTLRITGAPKTKYSKDLPSPPYAWNDGVVTEFLNSSYCSGGEANTMNPAQINDEMFYFLRGPKGKPSVQTCATLMRHYLPNVRNWAASNLNVIGTPVAFDEIEKALQHSDARVRRAGFNAISNYLGSWFTVDGRRNNVPKDVVAKRFMPYIRKTLENPKCDWWETDGAILALSRAGAENVREYLPLLKRNAQHKEMWMRQSAFFCMIRGLDQEIDGETMVFLSQCYAREGRPFLRNVMREWFRKLMDKRKDEEPVRIPKGVEQDVVANLTAPITNTQWVDGYVEWGVSRRDPYHVLETIEKFHPKDFVHFTEALIGVLDSWEEQTFYSKKQIKFCETLAQRAIDMEKDGRLLMERVAKAFVDKRKVRRGMTKVGERIKEFEQKYGPLKNAVEKPLVAQDRDTSALRKGLLGYWQFDEGDGTTSKDSSNNDNPATLKDASWEDGLIGKAVKMSKGQSVVIPGYKDPVTDGRIKNLTVSFWLKTKDYGSGRVGKGRHGTFRKIVTNWFYSYDAVGAGWDIKTPDNGLYAFATGAFDNGQHGLTAILNEDAGIDDFMFKVVDDGKTWHHIVMSYDGERKAFSLWVDGNPCDTTARWNETSTKGLEEANHIIPAEDAVLQIGGKFEEDGKVESFDEVAIWDRVLSDNEVELLYNNGFGSVIGTPKQ